MSSNDISLLSTKGAGKAVEKLLNIVSGAIGRLYTPLDKILNAHADAKARLILAQGKLDETDLSDRARQRITHTEERRQVNIDAILLNAVTALPTEVQDAPVDPDWAARFFENCKDVGNPEMREIWGRVLAGEVAQPGTFSRRTLDIVRAMDKSDANSFTRLCCASFLYAKGRYGFFVPDHEIYEYLRDNLVSTDEEVHLQNIGLLSGGYLYLTRAAAHVVQYDGKNYELTLCGDLKPGQNLRDLTPKFFPFTRAGEELAPIAGAMADKKFLGLWKKQRKGAGAHLLKATRKKL